MAEVAEAVSSRQCHRLFLRVSLRLAQSAKSSSQETNVNAETSRPPKNNIFFIIVFDFMVLQFWVIWL